VIDRRITQGTRGEAGRRYHERMWTSINLGTIEIVSNSSTPKAVNGYLFCFCPLRPTDVG
jgi:hypothetical protein